MKFYFFDIAGRKIAEHNGEVQGVGAEFIQYEKSFGLEEIYYKSENEKITEIICEAIDEKLPIKAVQEFLSNL